MTSDIYAATPAYPRSNGRSPSVRSTVMTSLQIRAEKRELDEGRISRDAPIAASWRRAHLGAPCSWRSFPFHEREHRYGDFPTRIVRLPDCSPLRANMAWYVEGAFRPVGFGVLQFSQRNRRYATPTIGQSFALDTRPTFLAAAVSARAVFGQTLVSGLERHATPPDRRRLSDSISCSAGTSSYPAGPDSRAAPVIVGARTGRTRRARAQISKGLTAPRRTVTCEVHRGFSALSGFGYTLTRSSHTPTQPQRSEP